MTRAGILLLAVLACLFDLARPVARAASDEFAVTRIPHHDGSGRGTIVEIDPTLPGAHDFLHDRTERLPHPGEVILPPPATPQPSPDRARQD